MHHPEVKHTLAIFDRLCDDLPPLVPDAIAKDMGAAREQMRLNYSLTVAELEDTMISFGKKVWPYREAFQEFVDIQEGKLGEKFLLGKLPPPMKRRYAEFKEYGGDWRDLHSGAPATFFTSEERVTLCHALVDAHREIVDYTRQAALSTERAMYETRIVEFQIILDDMEKRLDALRLMADDEQAHPELASEIRAHIRSFEFGMCLLAPRPEYAAVCNSAEHFEGRKKEKRHHAASLH